MKASPFLIRTLGPLLAFGGLAAAQEKGQFIEMRLQKISDPLQGPFRTFIPFQMGNQSLKALFDTGSSDLVVPRTASQICKVELQQCDEKGTGFLAGSFDPAKAKVSNTSIPLDAKFTGGSAFSGSFINTAVSAGQKSNNSLTMRVGLIEGGSLPPESPLFSVFGFGPVDGESAAPNQTYPNFPARLKQEKKIKCNALGLAVGDYRSNVSASAVLGGVDDAKYEGKLRAAPLVPVLSGEIPSFVINMSSVMVTDKDGRPKKIGRGGKDAGAGSRQDKGDGPSSKSTAAGSKRSENGSRSQRRDRWPLLGRQKRSVNGKARYGAYARSSTATPGKMLRRQEGGNLMANDGSKVVLLDTGAPDIALSKETVKGIAEALGTDFTEERGMGFVDCNLLKDGTSLTFGFNNDEISIVMPLDTIELGEEFDVPENPGAPAGPDAPSKPPSPEPPGAPSSGNSSGSDPKSCVKPRDSGRSTGSDNSGQPGMAKDSQDSRESGGSNKTSNVENPGSGFAKDQRAAGRCSLGIVDVDPEDPDKLNILGGGFLQSAYVVFDMDSKVVMMAQAKPNATESRIREYVCDAR